MILKRTSQLISFLDFPDFFKRNLEFSFSSYIFHPLPPTKFISTPHRLFSLKKIILQFSPLSKVKTLFIEFLYEFSIILIPVSQYIFWLLTLLKISNRKTTISYHILILTLTRKSWIINLDFFAGPQYSRFPSSKTKLKLLFYFSVINLVLIS